MNSELINGDSLVELKKLDDNVIDLVATDPPYGYSFMGKEWDKALPDKGIWSECLRVLKPGSFAYIMSSPRQDVLWRMMSDLESVGFNTTFTSMYWAYATGFPKALNVSKAVDKRLGVKAEVIGRNPNSIENSDKSNTIYESGTVGKTDYITKPSSEQAKKLDGSYAGFQPKPAVEVIIVCMKPLEEKGYIDQALKNGKGVSWFDDCRIPSEGNEHHRSTVAKADTGNDITFQTSGFRKEFEPVNSEKGRYPANLLVSDNAVDIGKVTKSSGGINEGKIGTSIYGEYKNKTIGNNAGGLCDSGDFSRYFDLDKWWEAQFIITPKASKSEKNKGCEDFDEKFQANAEFRPNHLEDAKAGSSGKPHGRYTPMKNNHPTVKPIKLMSYLITLGSRKGDIVLDPFMGSGTTPLASKQLGRDYIGIERDPEYFKICQARVDNSDTNINVKKDAHKVKDKTLDDYFI